MIISLLKLIKAWVPSYKVEKLGGDLSFDALAVAG